MREVEVGTPLPSVPPEKSPSANFAVAAPSSSSVPCFSLADARVPFVSRRCCEGAGTGLRRSGLCACAVVGRLIRSGWPNS